MIVKDEEHCILETLENVYKYIDYYIIVDTGSSDNTKAVIKKFFDEKEIKGELHDEPWKDFGYNRSKALEYCSGKCQYAWVIDADDLVRGDFKFPEKMTADGYNVQYGKGFVYWRCQIFRMDEKGPNGVPAWKYVGVLHEYPNCTKPQSSISYLKGNYFLESRRKGARNKVADKYKKDAAVFEEAMLKEGKSNSRYTFYLAQSYFDAGMFEKSLENYRKRVREGGWVEEVYYSQYRVAVCLARLGRSFLDIINEFIQATRIHPGRAEPFYEVARIFRMNKMYRHAYEYGKLGLPLRYHESYLFCTKAVFDYLLPDEVGISAYYIGDYKVARDLSTKLLVNPDLPKQFQLRIQLNKQFAEQKIQEIGEKAKLVLSYSLRIANNKD
jgi:glycosyltransferase involved in cell wall biosynthesis